jgi:hypothetical protein
MPESRRGARLKVALVAALSLAAAVIAVAASAGTPSGCTSIAAVPVSRSIEFGAAIQGIFNNFSSSSAAGCVDCHFAIVDGPAGNLDLTQGFSWSNLVNQPSSDDPNLTYVVPGQPLQSLLFKKVNCDVTGEQARMPLGGYGGGLSVEQQALIYDWIAAGAPVGITDVVFQGTFDIRGFDQ